MWKEWFEEVKQFVCETGEAKVFGIQVSMAETEDMYQAFKARLMDELHLETEHGDEVIINTYADDIEETQS